MPRKGSRHYETQTVVVVVVVVMICCARPSER